MSATIVVSNSEKMTDIIDATGPRNASTSLASLMHEPERLNVVTMILYF